MTFLGAATVAPPSGAGDSAAVAEWSAYLDVLARAVHEFDDRRDGDHGLPAFPTVEQPTSSCPVSLEPRRREIAHLLERATAALERRLGTVAGELADLRPRQARSPYRSDTGGAIDVLG